MSVRLLIPLLICLCLSNAQAAPSPAGPFVIFLAATGSDENSGLSRHSPILSLGKAQDILLDVDPNQDVEIQIAPGTYYDQRVRWEFTMENHIVRFMPLDDTKIRPTFDGCPGPDVDPSDCGGGTWFTLQAATGENTNVHFDYIRVQRYGTAISFNGNRNSPARFNGANRVYGSYFRDIGNGFNTDLSPSTAAIRLVNSDNNILRNNHFVDVRNIGQGSRLIHAIYVAHQSSGNEIVGNRIVNVSGDAIRLRDASNDNLIVRNRISRSGTFGFSDWYCDREKRGNCTKQVPECPSWENTFRNNVLDGTYRCEPMAISEFYQDEMPRRCEPPVENARRLHKDGNTVTADPCSFG